MEQTLDISVKTIVKIFLAIFIFYVLFTVRNIVIWLFFALVISLLLDPAINFLRKLRIPRIFAVIFVYLLIFGLLGLLIYLVSPIFILEINQFSQNIPEYFEKASPLLKDLGISFAQSFDEFTANLVTHLQGNSDNIVRAITVFFGGVSSTLTILTFAFFISLEENGTERVLALLVPAEYEQSVIGILKRAEVKVAGWFGARILACLFVGAASFIVFFLLNIKYAFTLALLTGFMNFVPFIGPLITSLIVILFVGISDSWLVSIYTIIALMVIQEIENKFITPILMKKILDLPPILVLVALLVGATIFGFLGMMFIVPVFGIIYEFLKEFLEGKKQRRALVSQEP